MIAAKSRESAKQRMAIMMKAGMAARVQLAIKSTMLQKGILMSVIMTLLG